MSNRLSGKTAAQKHAAIDVVNFPNLQPRRLKGFCFPASRSFLFHIHAGREIFDH